MPVAGGGGLDLRSGEEKLPAAQAGAGLASDASWHSGRSQSRFTGNGLLRPVEHCFYRTGESDHPAWNSRTGASHLGDGAAVFTASGQFGMVARLLPFCAPSRVAASGLCRASRTRWQASGATLSATDSSHGSRENEPTVDSGIGSLFSPAAGPLLSLLRAPSGFRGFAKWQRPLSDAESRWGWRATG